MHAVLLDRFGFAPGDVTVLTDDHDSGAGVLPTGANVKNTLAEKTGRQEESVSTVGWNSPRRIKGTHNTDSIMKSKVIYYLK